MSQSEGQTPKRSIDIRRLGIVVWQSTLSRHPVSPRTPRGKASAMPGHRESFELSLILSLVGPIFLAQNANTLLHYTPSPAYRDGSYRSLSYTTRFSRRTGQPALYATMKLQLRVRLGNCDFCICEPASLYRRLSQPLPQACKVRLAHGLHRA